MHLPSGDVHGPSGKTWQYNGHHVSTDLVQMIPCSPSSLWHNPNAWAACAWSAAFVGELEPPWLCNTWALETELHGKSATTIHPLQSVSVWICICIYYYNILWQNIIMYMCILYINIPFYDDVYIMCNIRIILDICNYNQTYKSSASNPTASSGNGNSMKQGNEAEEFIAWPP